MGKNTRPIPNSSAKTILENFGAKRVGADGAEEFMYVLHDIALNVSKKAVDIAKHAGRKTVKSEDIKLAFKMLE